MSAPPPASESSAPEATTPEKKRNRTMILVLVVLGVAAVSVPCIGVTAAVAIPSFIQYVRRSKVAEAEANLGAIHRAAEAYYLAEHATSTGELQTGCAVGSAVTPNVPGSTPRAVDPWPESFVALGFTPADPLRYRYEIVGDGRCGHGPSESIYSFRAIGDLDDDGITSMLERSAGTDAQGGFFAEPIYRLDELE